MKYTFHQEAEEELLQSINYYEDCEEGLGFDFAIEVYSTIKTILEHPEAWSIFDDQVRRCLTKRFPYGIIYSIENENIFILAVMHLHRQPDYWKKRC